MNKKILFLLTFAATSLAVFSSTNDPPTPVSTHIKNKIDGITIDVEEEHLEKITSYTAKTICQHCSKTNYYRTAVYVWRPQTCKFNIEMEKSENLYRWDLVDIMVEVQATNSSEFYRIPKINTSD